MKLTALWSPEQQFQHKNGAILTNGKIYVYLAGRTELAQIYVDDDGIHQSQNPVILDDNGRAVVFADEAYTYTAVVCDYYGQELFSFKPIGLGGPGSEAPKQIDIQSNSINVEKSYNERTNTETFTLEVKNSDCKSWIGRDGQSSVIPADTEVSPLALPSTNEYDGDFIDRVENNNTIFLKEGLYHVDCVIEFIQQADSEQNKLGQIEVFTGLGNGDESTNLEINETGPLCDDEVRHCIKQTFIRKVKAGSDLASSQLYFRPFSPVPLSSCKIKSLSIVELSITGNTEGANYYAGEHVQITENNIINVTGLQPSGDYVEHDELSGYQPSGNYATLESVTQGFYGVAQQINTLSGAIDDVAGSIPSLDGYATEQYVQSQVSGKADRSEIPSLEGYATESWVQNQHYLTSVPSEYATDQEVQAAVSGKADKSEIPSLAGYATEQYVQGQVSGKQDELEFTYDSDNKITSIDGHGIAGTGGGGGGGSEYIAGQYISIQNDIISVTGLQPSGDYATQEDVEAAVSGKADVSAIPSLDGYATESWVNEQGFLKEVPQGYATTEDVESATSGKMDKSQSADFYPMASNPSGYLTEHQSLEGYATQEWVNQQNFVDDDDLNAAISGKADVSAIPSVAGLASETFVTEHIEEATSGKMDYSAYTAPVNADWSATSGLAQILNKPETEDLTLGQYLSIQGGVLSVTGLQVAGSYASEEYVHSQVSGKQDALQFDYDEDQMISGINGSAIKSGDSLPEGVMNTSGLEYTAGGEISAYNNSAFHDAALNDLVNQNSGAWGGSGLNVSAGPGIKLNMQNDVLVASVDETVLYSGNLNTGGGTTVTFSEALDHFETIKVWANDKNSWAQIVFEFEPSWIGDDRVWRRSIPLILNTIDTGTNQIYFRGISLKSSSTSNITSCSAWGWEKVEGGSYSTHQNMITKVVGINRK